MWYLTIYKHWIPVFTGMTDRSEIPLEAKDFMDSNKHKERGVLSC